VAERRAVAAELLMFRLRPSFSFHLPQAAGSKVISELESSYSKGRQIESGTFESKPGRPVHYFYERDLEDHFKGFEVLDTGIAGDQEEHGEEGRHLHRVRYLMARRKS
jgi:hypothetical protein